MAALDSLFPSVIFTEPDYFIEPESDLLSGEIAQLSSEIPNGCFDNLSQPNLFGEFGINLSPAWNIEMGREHVRVGVFDDGIRWNHKEFASNQYNHSIQDTSRSYVYGWNFYDEPNENIKQPLPNSTFQGNFGNHGTQVASLITSSNGNAGMNGIAGGCLTRDWDQLSDDTLEYNGVKLFALKVNPPISWAGVPSPISHVANAIKNTSKRSNLQGFDFEYRLNLQNHSWGISAVATPNLFNPTNIQLLNDAIHYVNRLGVTVVTSRGNLGNQTYQVPACLDTTWMLCVGGTNESGNYLSSIVVDNITRPGSSIGPEVDIAAPADNFVKAASSILYDDYENFVGTSAAAPHATGVAALLMSYLNDTVENPRNLVPEDIEWILKHSATDVGTQGNDIYTGAGRLNAGAALQMVERPYRKLYHFSSNNEPINAGQITLIDTNRTIFLKEPYQVNQTTYLNVGNYLMDIYKVDKTIEFELDSGSTIVGIWPVHSQSGMLDLPINDTLVPNQRTRIIASSNNSATLRSYFYIIRNSLGQEIASFPNQAEVNFRNFAFSVLANNILASTNSKDQSFLKFYPNPTKYLSTLEVSANENYQSKIAIFNSQGKLVFENSIVKVKAGINTIQINTDNLSNGFYFLTFSDGRGKVNSIKFSVLK